MPNPIGLAVLTGSAAAIDGSLFFPCNLSRVAGEPLSVVTSTRGDPPMTHSRLAMLSTALGVALAAPAGMVFAQGMSNPPPVVKQNMERMAKQHLEKCYGINAVAKNDCAEGAHSCAGQATAARDLKSFVLLPAGDCGKIAGGKTPAS
jgi:uncharacterized membrane protein